MEVITIMSCIDVRNVSYFITDIVHKGTTEAGDETTKFIWLASLVCTTLDSFTNTIKQCSISTNISVFLSQHEIESRDQRQDVIAPFQFRIQFFFLKNTNTNTATYIRTCNINLS